MTTLATPSDLPPFVVRFDYVKDTRWPSGHGYDPRPTIPLTGITLHTDEHGVEQPFAAVCRYLRDSAQVSAHYSVGPDGEIQRFLDPTPWRAWHAGVSSWQGVPSCNDYSVGIETYHRQGELYPSVQLVALAWLCEQLMTDHPTITRAGVHLHRWCALPMGRKSDMTDFPDAVARAFITAL